MRNTVIVTMSLNVAHSSATALGERLLDVAEGLLELGVEIAGERFAGIIYLSSMPGDINGPARAFRDDRRGKRALDLPGATNERFFHRCAPPFDKQSSAWRADSFPPSRSWIPASAGMNGVSLKTCADVTSRGHRAWRARAVRASPASRRGGRRGGRARPPAHWRPRAWRRRSPLRPRP